MIDQTYKTARLIAIAVLGSTVLATGIALLVLPGPGILLIAIGLGILALEFAWARVWLGKVRRGISQVGQRQRSKQR